MSDGPEPACGQCGYSLHGLESDRCPECGAPRQQAVISRMSKGWSEVRRAAYMAWPLLCAMASFLVALDILLLCPVRIRAFETAHVDWPASKEYAGVTIEVERPVVLKTVTRVRSPGPPRVVRLEVEQYVEGGRIAVFGPLQVACCGSATDCDQDNLRCAGDLLTEDVLALMRTAGVDADSPAVIAEAAFVLKLLRAACSTGIAAAYPEGPFKRNSGGTIIRTSAEVPEDRVWPLVAAIVIGVALYVVGRRRSGVPPKRVEMMKL